MGRKGRGASLPERDGGGAQVGRGLQEARWSLARLLSVPPAHSGPDPVAQGPLLYSQPAGPGGLCGSAFCALANALRELAGLRNLADVFGKAAI